MSAQSLSVKPGIFIATPCYGGLLYYRYVESLIATMDWVSREQIPFATYLLANESLIQRGRNTCAHEFLKSGLQKLLFVDADISWHTDDLRRLYESKRTLIGGTYPMKKLPLALNVNPLSEHVTQYFDEISRTRAEYSAWAYAQADASGEVAVRHMPTGFMMIDRSVLLDLQNDVQKYRHVDMGKGITETVYEYFSAGSYLGEFETEDWYFCRLASEAGHPPYLNVNVVLPHTGTYTFEAQVKR